MTFMVQGYNYPVALERLSNIDIGNARYTGAIVMEAGFFKVVDNLNHQHVNHAISLKPLFLSQIKDKTFARLYEDLKIAVAIVQNGVFTQLFLNEGWLQHIKNNMHMDAIDVYFEYEEKITKLPDELNCGMMDQKQYFDLTNGFLGDCITTKKRCIIQ